MVHLTMTTFQNLSVEVLCKTWWFHQQDLQGSHLTAVEHRPSRQAVIFKSLIGHLNPPLTYITLHSLVVFFTWLSETQRGPAQNMKAFPAVSATSDAWLECLSSAANKCVLHGFSRYCHVVTSHTCVVDHIPWFPRSLWGGTTEQYHTAWWKQGFRGQQNGWVRWRTTTTFKENVGKMYLRKASDPESLFCSPCFRYRGIWAVHETNTAWFFYTNIILSH